MDKERRHDLSGAAGGRHVTSRHVTSGRHRPAVDKEAVTSRHVTSGHHRRRRGQGCCHVTSRQEMRRCRGQGDRRVTSGRQAPPRHVTSRRQAAPERTMLPGSKPREIMLGPCRNNIETLVHGRMEFPHFPMSFKSKIPRIPMAFCSPVRFSFFHMPSHMKI